MSDRHARTMAWYGHELVTCFAILAVGFAFAAQSLLLKLKSNHREPAA